MGNPTKAQIDHWNKVVNELAEREGIDPELAAAKLIRLLNSDQVQDAIRVEVHDRLDNLEGVAVDLEHRVATLEGRGGDQTAVGDERLTTLECEVKELKRQVEAIEFGHDKPSQHDQPSDEPVQYIPQDPDYTPQ